MPNATWDDLRSTNHQHPIHNRHQRAFSDQEAAEIRRRYATREATQRGMAREFGVDRNTIHHLVNQHTYRPDSTPPTTSTHVKHYPDRYPCLMTQCAAAWAAADAAYEERRELLAWHDPNGPVYQAALATARARWKEEGRDA